MEPKGNSERDAIEKIIQAVQSLKYGQVTVLVQDGRIIQIEKTEKMRLR